jgi:hypothetical protein
MVYVYDGDILVRQESGLLSIIGAVPDGASEPSAGAETGFDDAGILDLLIEGDVVRLLVEWERYAPNATEFMIYTRRFESVTWTPDIGEPTRLA